MVLAKKYLNPSSDIIEVLAGLDKVDAVLNALVDTLDQAIKDGRTSMCRPCSIEPVLAIEYLFLLTTFS